MPERNGAKPKIGPIGKPQDLKPIRPSSDLMTRVFPEEAEDMYYVHILSPEELEEYESRQRVVAAKQRKWDAYFMSFARLAAANTKCGSRKIGAALVKHQRVIATGYNGPAEGMEPCSERWRDTPRPEGMSADFSWPENNFCPRRVMGYPSGQGLEICVAAHAERNALLQAARLGIQTYGTTLYAYCGIPCKDCAIELVNAGVKEVVCLKVDYEYDLLGRTILEAGGVTIREIPDFTDDVFYNMPGEL